MKQISSKHIKSIEAVAERLRQIFAKHLHTLAKGKSGKLKDVKSELEKVCGVSDSAISKLLHTGDGGMNLFFKSLAHLADLTEDEQADVFEELLRKAIPATDADRQWFAIRDELGATESELYLASRAAYEAVRIKKEIDEEKKKKRKKASK